MDTQSTPVRHGFRSLRTRMILWVLLASGAVFLAAVSLSSRLSRNTAVRAAEQEALNAADAARNRVLMVLSSVERSTELLGASVETLQPQALALDGLLRRFVAGNSDVYGSTASFEPFAFDAPAEGAPPDFFPDPAAPPPRPEGPGDSDLSLLGT